MFGPHNAEVEGSSPSLTTKIKRRNFLVCWAFWTVLTTPHERALTLIFSELERSASEQSEVLLGTPGTLTERKNDTGTRFWVHRYSDALNRRQEIYLGKVVDPEIERRVSTMREMIATAKRR